MPSQNENDNLIINVFLLLRKCLYRYRITGRIQKLENIQGVQLEKNKKY